MNKLLYRVSDVVELTSRSRSAVYEDMASGALQYLQVGRRRLIEDGALARYTERLRSQASSQPVPRAREVDLILSLVDDSGRIDVDLLPDEATLADIRAAQRLLQERQPHNAA